MSLLRTGTVAVLLFAFCSASSAQTVEQLQAELAAKNARIKQLEQQLTNIEEKEKAAIFSKRTMAGKPSTFAKRMTKSEYRQPPEAPRTASAAPVVTTPAGVVPARPAPVTPSTDVDDTDRALEQTLVREGALLLPFKTFELTPQFSFSHWDQVQDPFVRNSYSGALTFRMGLPWTSQFSATLPYTFTQFRDGSTSDGFSDVGFLLSKELLRESDWRPNLVGSVGWTSPTRSGNTLAPIPYVSGFQVGLTASKRFDPLVVYGGVSYFSSADRNVAGTTTNPSDVVSGRAGASLAVSPATAVNAGFNIAYLTNPHGSDFVVPGSDRVLSSVEMGFTTILWKRTLFNITGQFGVTGHVPDFRVITSVPIRF